MCYKHRAVEDGYKRSGAVPFGTTVSRAETLVQALDSDAEELPAVVNTEDVSRYCPVCSQRLESRRCKLVCGVCGYYMSCADYY
ncbi:MAG TPA: hypothetical protein VN982_04995 [Candidatus Dormibacteraeota bacterium]|nr:hypothetical protein [Candidatus Dormibacteraeota bacterium]